MSDLAVAPGGDYNLVPYGSKPFQQSQPPRLAALATLFGLQPADVTRCSVLELGCASGGNIIPLALRFPGSRFRGIDLTERHVRDAQARIDALGLSNICIEQGDIGTLDLGQDRFDYIICHGVYSWVPPAVREAMLRIISRNLADSGVAYISYNVLPGWHMRGAIRDMMVYHAGMDGDPNMRVAKARWVLDNIAKSTRGSTPYTDMLRGEAKLLATLEDSYILGEFLERENAPCYFRDFVARAEEHGLTYLCEAEIQQCIAENISPDVGALIRVMSQNKLVPFEQYMDFFKGRTFRQTLLVKEAHTSKIERTIQPHRARNLHVSARTTIADKGDGSAVFTGMSGATLHTGNTAAREAVKRLSHVFPDTRTVAELAAEVRAAGVGTDRASVIAGGDVEAGVLDAVFKMVLAGIAEVSTVPLRIRKGGTDLPKATPLARLDASQGFGWTTGPTHGVVPLDVVAMAVLPFMDGSHGREALQEKLLMAVREGRVRLIDNTTKADLEGERLTSAAGQHLSAALESLAAVGLLEQRQFG